MPKWSRTLSIVERDSVDISDFETFEIRRILDGVFEGTTSRFGRTYVQRDFQIPR